MSSLTITALGGIAAAVALSGCAAMNRTRPGDMSVPEHEGAARAEAEMADEAAKRATVVGRGAEYERYSAIRHRDLAKEHAAAAEQRRQDVDAVCSGANASPGFTSMRVTSVEPIREADVAPAGRHPRGYYPERLKGARIAVTPDAIAPTDAVRAIECEAARVSAGMDSSSADNPLGVRTAKTIVRVANSRLLVEVRGDGGSDAAEILRRAEALAHVSPGSTR